MTKKSIKNIGASVRAKLLILARQQGIDFNRMLLLYVQERFLYRLSKSTYRDQFILKGGVLFYGIHQKIARPTKDIDLLAKNIPSNQELFISYIRDILLIEVADGIEFLTKNISVEQIVETAEYEGLRVKFKAKLDTAIQTLQIDIGFSDYVFPHPITFDYPILLEGEKIILAAYSWESVVAEKFEAIVKLGELNSRMKDFYDIFFLQQQQNFVGKKLKSAIRQTFENRKTDFDSVIDIFSNSFINNENKQTQWKAFIRKNGLSISESFKEIIKHLQQFINPVISAIMNNRSFNMIWEKSKQKWIEGTSP